MENGNEPATKRDLQNVKDELRQAIQTANNGLRDELIEVVRDSETRLLQAFYGFVESNNQRISLVESSTNAVIARLGTLESRITQVEKRLNMPPAA